MKFYYLSFLGFVVFFSCQSPKENFQPIILKAQVEEENTIIAIHLDSVSSGFHSIQGLSRDTLYYFFNGYNLNLYFYQLKDSVNEIENQFRLPLDPSVNFRNVDDIYVHNRDSIFVYDDSNEYGQNPDVFLINGEGIIIDTYKVFDLTAGDPFKVNKMSVFNGPTMFYHKGKLYFTTSPTRGTDTDNFHPLFVYDLATGIKKGIGFFPVKFKKGFNYLQFSYTGFMSFDLLEEEIYFSFGYDANLYQWKIRDQQWEIIPFKTDYFKQPQLTNNQTESIVYLPQHTWFMNIALNPQEKLVYRKLLLASDPSISSGNDRASVQGNSQKFYLFGIDPATGNYWELPDFNLYQIRFVHPIFGPLVTTQVDYESMNIDPQDYIFLRPVKFSTIENP